MLSTGLMAVRRRSNSPDGGTPRAHLSMHWKLLIAFGGAFTVVFVVAASGS
jgi:hypothetical protein